VDRVIVCGLALEYCVKATALDARKLGFEVIVVDDAVQGIEAKTGDSAYAKDLMKKAGCMFAATHEVIANLSH